MTGEDERSRRKESISSVDSGTSITEIGSTHHTVPTRQEEDDTISVAGSDGRLNLKWSASSSVRHRTSRSISGRMAPAAGGMGEGGRGGENGGFGVIAEEGPSKGGGVRGGRGDADSEMSDVDSEYLPVKDGTHEGGGEKTKKRQSALTSGSIPPNDSPDGISPHHHHNKIRRDKKLKGGLVSQGKGEQKILFIGRAPHDQLFKHVDCVVHHGGAGTGKRRERKEQAAMKRER